MAANDEHRRSVRRRLNFDDVEEKTKEGDSQNQGTADITDLTNDNILANQRKKAMEKWNFDFENELPLEGDWEWKRVEPVEIVDSKKKVSTIGDSGNENRNV